jgi:hypothetical protein
VSLLKPVTPEEAKHVWVSIPNPSARRVAKALTQSGRRVHHSTIARWRAQDWRPVANSLHPLDAARQALEVAAVLTGDPVTKPLATCGARHTDESSGGKPCRSPTSPWVARCWIIHRRGIHPTSPLPFYSILDGGRRNNSVTGSLSPDSYRSGRVAVTPALGPAEDIHERRPQAAFVQVGRATSSRPTLSLPQ